TAGTVLLRSRLRSRDHIRTLFSLFGECVLQAPVEYRDSLFDLDCLKRPFHPLPDAPDLEMVRVRALHPRYPERVGPRQVKPDTLASDGPSAIEELLRAHVGDGALLDDLRVSHAQLELR